MALFLAVSNRKGGVGKSTISTMLAYAFAVWSKKKVLLIDLDAQSNSSLILLGGEQVDRSPKDVDTMLRPTSRIVSTPSNRPKSTNTHRKRRRRADEDGSAAVAVAAARLAQLSKICRTN